MELDTIRRVNRVCAFITTFCAGAQVTLFAFRFLPGKTLETMTTMDYQIGALTILSCILAVTTSVNSR